MKIRISGLKELVGWAGAFLVLFGYYLNANMDPNCWLVWIVANSLVAGYSFENKAYPTGAMSLVLVALSIYGHFSWRL